MSRRLLAAGLILIAGAAAAQPLGTDYAVDPPEILDDTDFIKDLVIVPIPISNPTIGTGLAVVAMPFYRLGADSPLSNTVVAAGFTSSGSWGIGAAQSTRLPDDRLRLDGFLGYVDMRTKFYGVGTQLGAAGVSVPVVQRGFAFVPEVITEVAKDFYAGVRYQGVKVTTHPEQAPPAELQPFFAAGAEDATSSGFGLVTVYDTRDHEMTPSSGWLIDFKSNFADGAFGSSSDYSHYTLAVNRYGRPPGTGVVALRGYLCRTTGETPLFDLCLFGSGNDLRGYEAGRYRDRAMAAAQAEYRFPLTERFGMVVFAGAGKVGESFGELAGNRLLASVGTGVRWLAATEARVNLSLDFAIGRDASSLYLYVKESF